MCRKYCFGNDEKTFILSNRFKNDINRLNRALLKTRIMLSVKSKSMFLYVLLCLNLAICLYLMTTMNNGQLETSKRPLTIFCLILSTNETINTKGKVVFESWAKKCDMTKFVLKFPESSVHKSSLLRYTDFNYKKGDAIDFNHLLELPNFQGDSGQRYNLTAKVYSSLSYIYSTYSAYDWYLKADQDTFVFVDNLRMFLSDRKRDEAISYGFNFAVKGGYQSGGAGYVLSNEALRRLTTKLDQNKRFCPNKGVEDLDVGTCLRRLDVPLGSSIDEFGRERFHPLSLTHHYIGNYPEWIHVYAQNKLKLVEF
jgi:glycoprotein-N-acetylgalactosamine 3-beta-galactosyltransferase